MGKRVSDEQIMNDRIDRSSGPDNCWPWVGKSFSSDGYGRVWRNGRTINAHKWVWQYVNGRLVPDGLIVRHMCIGGGNPWCCNPAHLEIGTHKDNSADSMKAGRKAKGERCRHTKLTANQVVSIRLRRRAGESNSAIARSLGMANQTISELVRGRTWKHVPMPEMYQEARP